MAETLYFDVLWVANWHVSDFNPAYFLIIASFRLQFRNDDFTGLR